MGPIARKAHGLSHLVHSDVCVHMDVLQVQVPPLDVHIDLLPCTQGSMLAQQRLLKIWFPCRTNMT